jgi:protease-4
MAFEADYMVDRRRLKRRLAFWRVFAVLALVGVAVVALNQGDGVTGIAGRDYVSRLQVSGVILDEPRRRAAIRRVAEDDNAKALIVHIDSPGGTVVGGEALYRVLREVAAKKPVVAVMGQLATSAGYMIALAAERIYAREGTVTGSIGVLFQTADVTKLMEKIGVDIGALRSGPLKAVPNPFEKTSPEARAATQALVDDMYAMFLGMVTERRGMADAKARALSDGRVFTGRMALANGLVDALGGEREARRWLQGAKKIDPGLPVRDIRLKREVEDWLEYAGSLAGKTVLSERLTLDGLVSVWHPQLR